MTTQISQVLQALADGHDTSTAIAAATKLPRVGCSSYLCRLTKLGKVTRTIGQDPPFEFRYRLAAPGEYVASVAKNFIRVRK
jgi:DNA-binding IclR family transcriptional regulator